MSNQLPPTYEEFVAQMKAQVPTQGQVLTVSSAPSYMRSGDVIQDVDGELRMMRSRPPDPPKPSKMRARWDKFVWACRWPIRLYYGWKVGRFFSKFEKWQ